MNEQVAMMIFHTNLEIMKEILSLAEFRMGKYSEQYRYFRRMTMNSFYWKLGDLFVQMEKSEMITRCECGASLRRGFSECLNCGGSGYRNKVKEAISA